MGKIKEIYIARSKRQPVEQVEVANLEAGKGIVGDRYHQLAEQHLAKSMDVMQNHVSLVEREALDKFMLDHGLNCDYGDFRRSVITTGIDLNALVGKQFRMGDAVLYGIELCEPCSYLASIIHKAVLPEMAVSAGLRATVIESGSIKAGDSLGEIVAAA